MRTAALAMLFVLLWASPAAADDFTEWSWPEANLTMCEGFGGHGTYRVTARAKVEKTGGELKISHLTVVLSMGSVPGSVFATGKLEIRREDETIQTVTLEKPWFAVLAPENAGPMLTLPRIQSSEPPSLAVVIAH